MEFKEISMPPVRLGIDDLKETYAFLGASQGDATKTNNLEVYKSSGGWLLKNSYFSDADIVNQEAIDRKSLELKQENEAYIKELTEAGGLGEIVKGATIRIVYHPIYDAPSIREVKDVEVFKYHIMHLN